MKHLSVTTKLWLGVGSIVLSAIVIVGHAGYNSASHQKQFNEQDACCRSGWIKPRNGVH